MLGAFKSTQTALGGLLWKTPWRMSKTRKMRTRMRLRGVDDVIATLQQSGIETRSLDTALALPSEAAMRAKDKYTTYSPHDPNFRKSLHRTPTWTKVTRRTNPAGY